MDGEKIYFVNAGLVSLQVGELHNFALKPGQYELQVSYGNEGHTDKASYPLEAKPERIYGLSFSTLAESTIYSKGLMAISIEDVTDKMLNPAKK